MKVSETEAELEKLESDNLSAENLAGIAEFWMKKYYQTSGVDHLKSLVNNISNQYIS